MPDVKLYLSSYRLGKESHRLVPVAERNNHAVIIPNALDAFDVPDQRDETLSRESRDLEQLGFSVEILDLREYFGKQVVLKDKLRDVGFVWTVGGNVFVLRAAMQESGLDAILIFNMREQHFVYGGYSAGACVTGPTLRGLELVDDCKAKPEGYPKKTIWEGIGLIDYCIAPHYQSDHPESELIEKTVRYFNKHDIPYKALRDGEVVVVE